MQVKIGQSILELVQGDITRQDTEAVVNAANSRLAPGGGVAGAIHRAAGPRLWQECRGLAGCQTGQAKITSAYNLPNKYVIHTVGPIYRGAKSDARMLESAYTNSLKLAEEKGVKSVAFPAISTGAFGYPVRKAACLALDAVINYLRGNTKITLVRLVLYDGATLAAHKDILKKIRQNLEVDYGNSSS